MVTARCGEDVERIEFNIFYKAFIFLFEVWLKHTKELGICEKII